MKRFVLIRILILLAVFSIAIWLYVSWKRRADGVAKDKNAQVKIWSIFTTPNAVTINEKTTGIAFPGIDSKDVEVTHENSLRVKDDRPDITFTIAIKSEEPPILTRAAYEKLQVGMTFSQVGEALGGVMTRGEMSEGFSSRLEMAQGKRRIFLTFIDGKLTEKSSKDLD